MEPWNLMYVILRLSSPKQARPKAPSLFDRWLPSRWQRLLHPWPFLQAWRPGATRGGSVGLYSAVIPLSPRKWKEAMAEEQITKS